MSVKLYHLSHKKNRSSILKNGLELRASNGIDVKYPPSIFVSNSKKNLAFEYVGWAQENIDVWEITTDQSIFPDTFSSTGHFYIKNAVLPGNLKLLKCL